ncbi:hypothetical protein, partial [Exiguobacterium sp. AM39-5BH]|uniref:hypothetical protein n=1 Tax=Exiguobacterium sp. AM39-5BH TaxID=2292355 RepID=UPI001F2BAE9D
MEFSLRYNNLLGISPTKNLIENIGVDEHSIHGGTSFENTMTRRFCSMKSYEMKFPLVHPPEIKIDKVYEKKIGKIILHPYQDRVKRNISKVLRKLIRFEDDKPLFYKYR